MIKASKMWIWGRIKWIKWIYKVSNKEVLIRAKENITHLYLLQKRNRNWIGHIKRWKGILMTILEDTAEGERRWRWWMALREEEIKK